MDVDSLLNTNQKIDNLINDNTSVKSNETNSEQINDNSDNIPSWINKVLLQYSNNQYICSCDANSLIQIQKFGENNDY